MPLLYAMLSENSTTYCQNLHRAHKINNDEAKIRKKEYLKELHTKVCQRTGQKVSRNLRIFVMSKIMFY